MKHVSNQYSMKPRPLKSATGNLLLVTLIAAICFSLAAPAWAGSSGKRKAQANQEEGQTQTYKKTRATIKSKSLQHLFTIGRKFAVNKETVIVGTNGKEVSLKKMLVPCEVVVSYVIEKGVPTAKRVDIKRVLDGASWQWTAESPQ